MSDATSQTVYFYNRHPISCEIILAKLSASRGHLEGLRPEELFPHDQDHYGGIYQATNWIYDGHTGQREKYIYKGQELHPRTASSTFGGSIVGVPGLRKVHTGHKYRYLYPLDDEMKAKVIKLSKPYPKKPCVTSIESDAASNPTGEGDCNVIVTLPSSVEEISYV